MMHIPDHASFARRLGRTESAALLTAYEGRDGWQVHPILADTLRAFSLVAIQGPHLSAFGLKVRQVLLDMRGVKCPLAQRDTALENIVTMPAWKHLAPLMELKPLYRWMREPSQRLRKAGLERLKSGAIAKNPQRMGPLTLDARIEALDRILDIQRRARVDLINAEEQARIRELIAAKTYPDKWSGDEPLANLWLDSVYGDGTEQPILFRDLVGT